MSSRRRFVATLFAALALTGRAGTVAAEKAVPGPPSSAVPSVGPSPVATPAAPASPEGEPPPGPGEPLAGFAGERAFLRTPNNELVLLPGLRLQVGGALLPRGEPKSGFSLRHARVELAGWMGPFYFDVAGDFAPANDPAAPNATAADAYVAFMPQDELVIVQAGQFDAPFSLENRTLDGYTPFIERSLAVRALGAPRQKELGLMVHGTDAARTFYYSAGVFNGDGPDRPNADNQVDFIGRVVVAPLARTSFESFRGVSLGASAWYGQHLAGTPFPRQTTPGGFVVFDPRWTTGQAAPLTLELHENGRMLALGGELSAPLGHFVGVRVEGIFKKQDLAEDNILPADGSTIDTRGRASLQGIAGYGEAWVWLLGDDRQLPAAGLQLPARLGRVVEPPPRPGVVLTARAEILKEDLSSTQVSLGDPNLATTRVVAFSAGLSTWYGRRARASVNYVFTVVSGTTENVKTIEAVDRTEQELLLLLATSL